MSFWKRIASCVVFAAMASMVFAQPPGGPGGPQLSPEERAALAKQTRPLAAKAIAQYVGLADEAAKKFAEAYIAESEAAAKRREGMEQGGDFMALMQENSEKMQKVLAANMSAEQAKKAQPIVGGFGSLDRLIQPLVRSKVEAAKIDKALPVLVKYAVAQGEMSAKMREGGGPPSADMQAKMTELREKTVKELEPIIGAEAAAAWQQGAGRGGRRGGGGGGGN